MGRLTTHVLDLASGAPAAGLRVTLDRLDDPEGLGKRERVADAATNSDGRCDAPLLEGAALTAGLYELAFHAGSYWRAQPGDAPGFLDVIPIRFRVTDPGAHYHVPLLLSPFGFSTYRGS